MKGLQTFNKGAIVLAAALAGSVTPLISEAYKPTLGSGMSGGLIFAVVVISLLIVQVIVDGITSRSRTLRRFLLGDSYIEGDWLDISSDSESNIVGAAHIYIYYKDDRLQISGITLRAKDMTYASWDDEYAFLQRHTLAYGCNSYTNTANSPIERGYAELKFSGGEGVPLSYSGLFYDIAKKVIITLEGTRIMKAESLRKLVVPEERRKFLAEVLTERKSAVTSSGAASGNTTS